jgi:uncharacterized protein
MKKYILIAAGLVIVLLLAALVGCTTGTTTASNPSGVSVNLNNQQEGIWVSGEGKVTVTPDIATLQLGVSVQAPTVAEAQSKAATAMDEVMKALTAAGIAKNDIKTQYFNIQQLTRYDQDTQKEVVTGYQVSNTVSAKIRKVDDAGSVIDAVASAGGDYTRINSISFGLDDPTKQYPEARKKAIDDAKSKAQQLADAAGVKLGKIVYITESTNYNPPVPIYYTAKSDSMGSVPTTAISPGETDVTINVQMNYTLQ